MAIHLSDSIVPPSIALVGEIGVRRIAFSSVAPLHT